MLAGGEERRGGTQVILRPARWVPGGPPPWSGLLEPGRRIDLESTLGAVAARPVVRGRAPSFPGARLSAVLIALLGGDEGAEVLLTRRALHLTSHKGEVSFPGGRVDPGETPVEGALREAMEEVALDPSLVEVVGELRHLSTVVSRSYIVPVVGRLIERPVLHPATDEVDRIMFVPLAELTRPEVYRQERWGEPPLDRALHFFELEDETVWGATGHLLVELLSLAAGLEP